MPRKNNPKETVERILAASMELFYQKGFDKATMQDIVTASQMSKGAIFHHFKSKEEIFNTVMEKQYEYVIREMSRRFSKLKDLTAKEKLIHLLKWNLKDDTFTASAREIVTITNSPRLMLAILQNSLKRSAPAVAEIIRQGTADGSITTEFPDECAEIFMLLLNIWCDPYFSECDLPAIHRRMKLFQVLMKKLGVDIISDEIVTQYIKFTEKQLKEVEKWKMQHL